MPASSTTSIVKAASLLVGLVSALLFSVLIGGLAIAYWRMSELTDYSGGFVRIVPTGGAVLSIASVLLVVSALLIRRFLIRAGLLLWARVSTISIVLVALTVAVYVLVSLGLLDRLGA